MLRFGGGSGAGFLAEGSVVQQMAGLEPPRVGRRKNRTESRGTTGGGGTRGLRGTRGVGRGGGQKAGAEGQGGRGGVLEVPAKKLPASWGRSQGTTTAIRVGSWRWSLSARRAVRAVLRRAREGREPPCVSSFATVPRLEPRRPDTEARLVHCRPPGRPSPRSFSLPGLLSPSPRTASEGSPRVILA